MLPISNRSTVPSTRPRPPTPPPLPPRAKTEANQPQPNFKIAEKESGFWAKFKHAQGAFHESSNTGPREDHFAPKTGPHFFYGTLMDPEMLMEILDLKETPILRSAKVVGYSCKLWGQYPAMINGPQGGIVEGAMYDVQTLEHAVRLAEYETKAYKAVPCIIRFIDGEEPSEVTGTTFRYAGPTLDLKEGNFDLKLWLRHMGRRTIDKN